MGTWNVSKLWFMALLLVVFVAGCGREQGVIFPTLSAISPNRGTQGQTVAVTLTGTSFATGATINGTGTGIVVSNATVVNSTQITATFAIAANATLGAVNISVTSAGQTTNTVTYTIVPPLTVTSTVPTNGASNVPINQVLSATFSQAVACATITTTGTAPTFTLKGPAGAVAVMLTSCLGSTATFTPTSPLASNTTGAAYTATLTTGVQDSLGDPLLSNYVWSFATAALPIVTSTIPANNATGVPVNQVLSATFSEAMNCATIASTGSAPTFTLTHLVGTVVTPVPGGVAVNCLGASATFTPGSLLAPNTKYTALITTGATSSTGGAMASPYSWTFTTELAPTVISTVPTIGATGVPFYQVLSATFSEEMICSTVITSFTLSNSATLSVSLGGLVACSGASATFTPASPLAPLTKYTATISTGATSPTGAPLVPYSWSFMTGAAPPTVTAIAPLNNATGVGLNTTITAQFDEAMNATSVISAFSLTAGVAASLITPCVASAGTSVAGTPTYNAINNIITFTPTSPGLAPLTCYTATVTTLATSSGAPGIAMSFNYVCTFATGAAPALTPPTVISTVPLTETPSVTGVPLNQEVTATFSVPMDDNTITLTTFTLTYGTPAVSVSGVVSYNAGGPTAIFIPNSDLLPNTTYTATITGGVHGVADLAGANMVSNYVWNFTTAAAVAVIPPTVVSTTPTGTSECLNAAISATFSTAMNATTFNTLTFAVTGPDGLVTGTFSQDITGTIITFTPASNLVPSSTYTVTMSTPGVTDLAGIPLAAAYSWNFTTVASACLAAVPLGAATPFGGFGGAAGMTNSGLNTVINGDIGTTGASSTMTGFHDTTVLPYIQFTHGCIYTESTAPAAVGVVNGGIFTAPGTSIPSLALGCTNEGTGPATLAGTTAYVATQALADATTAYTTLQGLPTTGPDPGAATTDNLGGLTIYPGVYSSASGAYGITGSDLTLDAQGNANAVWVFQMPTGGLTVGLAGPLGARSVNLINGAQAGNVFWACYSNAVINAAGGGLFVGTVLAQAGVVVSTAGNAAITTINGRLLGLDASVTLVNTVINVPGQ